MDGVDNEALYHQYQLLSLHGQSKDALAKTKLGAWEYDIKGPWYKCNMTDIMAAIGLAQLERYPEMLKKRQKMVAQLNKAIDELNAEIADKGVKLIYLDHTGANHCSSHHLYIVRLTGKTREQVNDVIIKMAERGIATNVHYKPLPMMTAYKALGFDIKDYPNAYKMFENTMTLPLNTRMSQEDLDYVIENFVDIVKTIA
jgi:dTDP-4-amino-4,6-dideoxygalactose transaminase